MTAGSELLSVPVSGPLDVPISLDVSGSTSEVLVSSASRLLDVSAIELLVGSTTMSLDAKVPDKSFVIVAST